MSKIASAYAKRKTALAALQYHCVPNGTRKRTPEHEAKIKACREAYEKADAYYRKVCNESEDA